jgi:hypothetical protein
MAIGKELPSKRTRDAEAEVIAEVLDEMLAFDRERAQAVEQRRTVTQMRFGCLRPC